MKIHFVLHERGLYRWAGVFEGITSVFIAAHLNWFTGLVAFILLRFIITTLLEMVIAKLDALAQN